MADILVGNISSNHDRSQTIWGTYWLDAEVGLNVQRGGAGVLEFNITDDGGATWTDTVIDNDGNAQNIACFFDQEIAGDTGTLLHIAWLQATDDECRYVTVDISDETVSTIQTIASGLTIGTTLSEDHQVCLTKTKNGNLLVAFRDDITNACYRSTDGGSVWTSRAVLYDGATANDSAIMFPADTGDDADACAVYFQSSNIEIRMYDDSADSWTTTEIDAAPAHDLIHWNMDASIRHSDEHLIVVCHSNDDGSDDDLMVFDVTVDSIASPSITGKTNIFTNQSESAQCAIVIDQNNDDIYVAHLKGGTWLSEVDVVFHKSTDGGTTWGSEQAYSEATADDCRLVHGGRTIGTNGGRIQWFFANTDLNDTFINTTNDIELGVGTNTQINIGDSWKEVQAMKINIGDVWKDVVSVKINIGDTWKDVF